MTRWFPIAVALALGSFVTPAFAAPEITETTRTYAVDAATLSGLRSQMASRGPNNFWAYTEWNVRWSARCEVEVDVIYTMPEHTNPAVMPNDVRVRFDAMLTALFEHEKLHGLNGINAAREIKADQCRKPRAIIRKYNRADRDLDKATNHGIDTGATLD